MGITRPRPDSGVTAEESLCGQYFFIKFVVLV